VDEKDKRGSFLLELQEEKTNEEKKKKMKKRKRKQVLTSFWL
jgi:hypothetical protein